MILLIALLILTLIFGLCGLLLGFFAQKYRVERSPLTEQIDAILPQTQCGQCGYAGCKPYAEAIAAGAADINQCPPGGQEGVDKLAALLGVESKPLNGEHGEEKPKQVAFVIEQWCIGCTKCIQACPVDAIVGTNQRMHTIIEQECTGCELCVSPCPTSCIEMRPIASKASDWIPQKPVSIQSDMRA